jgi:prepilin-type N-terminal cleavage/methylation domain-containing protein
MAVTTQRDDRKSGREDGFGLVELCVVLVVVAVLLGIAVVTLLAARERSADRAAQSRARQALITQKSHYADAAGDYGGADELQPMEPSVRFREYTGDAPQVLGEVYVRAEDNEAIMVSRSTTGTCFWVKEAPSGTLYADLPCSEGEPGDDDFRRRW